MFGTPLADLTPQILPLLPLRDLVVFPQRQVPLFVGRAQSIRALDAAKRDQNLLFFTAQKNARLNNPTPDDLYTVGTIGKIIQRRSLPDDTVQVLIEGRQRGRIERFIPNDEFFMVEAAAFPSSEKAYKDQEALVRQVHESFESYVSMNERLSPEFALRILEIESMSELSDAIASQLTMKFVDKQALLEMDHPAKRLERLYELIQGEIEILMVEKQIQERVQKKLEKNNREYYLKEQMNVIREELSLEGEDDDGEFAHITRELKKSRLSQEAKARIKSELPKLKQMPPISSEATVIRNYLDWIVDLPWNRCSKDKINIAKSETILEEGHYGLGKAKSRIIEYLAVLQLVKKMNGPILCLVGPPGVGKTSLARSIAEATGRQYVRMSLGGVRDEAEIRGHRRTYVGAMPGKILQSLKKANTNNPVFLLDEIDKLASDFRGDPSSALLEVLDPEQNATFNDHYLDLDYDLSKVMFIATANDLRGIPAPLRDRMEIIELSGYTALEKEQIARRFLIPKQMERNGLKELEINWDKDSIPFLIHGYTREAGVRNLEREIASILRKIAKNLVEKRQSKKGKVKKKMSLSPKELRQFLGEPKFSHTARDEEDAIGVTHGLAVTLAGGELLPTEVTLMPGTGQVKVTGNLAKIMEESAHAALSYVRSQAYLYGLANDFYKKIDIHIHFPEGAIPKDGPSAGITMVSSLVSALTRIPVKRDVAMTGEITLRGRVLPIGGLKEKVIAAHREGMTLVLIPKDNQKDLIDIPEEVREAVKIVPVGHVSEVLDLALTKAIKNKKRAKISNPLDHILLNEGKDLEAKAPIH